MTVALAGDGADELLAGYPTYTATYLHRLYRRVPAWVRRGLVAPLVRRLPVSESKLSLDDRMRRFVAAGDLEWEDAHASWRLIHDAGRRRRLLSPIWGSPGVDSDAIRLYRAAFERSGAKHPLDRMLYADTRFYLPNDMLVKVDRTTMAHGLEAREPFLDFRLVEFAASVPPALKLRRFHQGKYILKAAMEGRLPAAVLGRRKAGFNVPKGRWYKRELRDFVMDHLAPARVREMGVLDEAVVSETLQEHFDGRADWSHQIWCLLTLVLWWDQFLGPRRAPKAFDARTWRRIDD